MALRQYEANLKRAYTLQHIEKKLYKDPPKPEQRDAVEALRGGCVVLMIATLERYLKDGLEEYVSIVADAVGSTSHPALPPSLVEHNDLNFLCWIVRDQRASRQDKLRELRRVSQEIANAKFVPESFNRTRANPGPSTIKTLFKEYGVENPFAQIEVAFKNHYKTPVAGGFVETMLKSIVDRRNEVAHEGYSLNISREDIAQWLKFLGSFGKAADNILRDRTRQILGR